MSRYLSRFSWLVSDQVIFSCTSGYGFSVFRNGHLNNSQLQGWSQVVIYTSLFRVLIQLMRPRLQCYVLDAARLVHLDVECIARFAFVRGNWSICVFV